MKILFFLPFLLCSKYVLSQSSIKSCSAQQQHYAYVSTGHVANATNIEQCESVDKINLTTDSLIISALNTVGLYFLSIGSAITNLVTDITTFTVQISAAPVNVTKNVDNIIGKYGNDVVFKTFLESSFNNYTNVTNGALGALIQNTTATSYAAIVHLNNTATQIVGQEELAIYTLNATLSNALLTKQFNAQYCMSHYGPLITNSPTLRLNIHSGICASNYELSIRNGLKHVLAVATKIAKHQQLRSNTVAEISKLVVKKSSNNVVQSENEMLLFTKQFNQATAAFDNCTASVIAQSTEILQELNNEIDDCLVNRS